MKAYQANFKNADGSATELTIGGENIAQAARKARDVEEAEQSECTQLSLTDRVII